jgi:hypothetical protein
MVNSFENILKTRKQLFCRCSGLMLDERVFVASDCGGELSTVNGLLRYLISLVSYICRTMLYFHHTLK